MYLNVAGLNTDKLNFLLSSNFFFVTEVVISCYFFVTVKKNILDKSEYFLTILILICSKMALDFWHSKNWQIYEPGFIQNEKTEKWWAGYDSDGDAKDVNVDGLGSVHCRRTKISLIGRSGTTKRKSKPF